MKALILVESNYEDLEVWYPKLRLIEAGCEVKVAGTGEKNYASKHGYPCPVDGNVEDFKADQFEILVVPGGWAPDRLRRYPAVLDLVRDFARLEKIIGAICHAGWVLVSANVIRGRRMTSVPAIKDDMKNAGAIWLDEPVVVDGNFVSAQVPKDLPEFCRQILVLLQSRAAKVEYRAARSV
ncbi:MAG TPA: type 1 glutamine amidotransferase domain-containing protein [Acidobacteriota bacterium]|jgi:protease I